MSELGKRYKCYKCGSNFYDLNRPLPLCPSCGEDQNNRDESGHSFKRKRSHSSFKKDGDESIRHDDNDFLAEPEERDDYTGSDEAEVELAHDDDGAREEDSDEDSAEERE